MNRNYGSEGYLLKLKLALAAGGLAVTILGAGLLGEGRSALSNDPILGATVESSVTTNVEIGDPDELDLKLEAIPTVVAPTSSSAPLAFGHSSG